jgi:hypothetical protein
MNKNHRLPTSMCRGAETEGHARAQRISRFENHCRARDSISFSTVRFRQLLVADKNNVLVGSPCYMLIGSINERCAFPMEMFVRIIFVNVTLYGLRYGWIYFAGWARGANGYESCASLGRKTIVIVRNNCTTRIAKKFATTSATCATRVLLFVLKHGQPVIHFRFLFFFFFFFL